MLNKKENKMEKKLYRSREQKVIGGVAGGLANYLDIDPVILRIIFILITIFEGFGILVYIILWIAIKEEPQSPIYRGENKNNFGEDNPSENKFGEFDNKHETKNIAKIENVSSPNNTSGKIILGVILILLGIFFLMERFIPFFDFEILFALGTIIIGVYLIYNSFNKSEVTNENI
ncbi:MAG: hypothetical protein CR986_07400 [Ignavibacteriae bacterium]|nr:MAG: hypothetical protein CR986_07400 [Ignavibacteriota bacterium]